MDDTTFSIEPFWLFTFMTWWSLLGRPGMGECCGWRVPSCFTNSTKVEMQVMIILGFGLCFNTCHCGVSYDDCLVFWSLVTQVLEKREVRWSSNSAREMFWRSWLLVCVMPWLVRYLGIDLKLKYCPMLHETIWWEENASERNNREIACMKVALYCVISWMPNQVTVCGARLRLCVKWLRDKWGKITAQKPPSGTR
jgi:hypothetical protein